MERCYRFGAIEVRPEGRELWISGERTDIGARAFDLLLALIERHGSVVTKGELLDAVWPGMSVEENNLAAHVSELRKVLGFRALATIPGRGYQFTLVADEARPTDPGEPVDSRTNVPRSVDALVGRDDEIAAVVSMLDQHRAVEVVGPGGIGKTRLAQEVARARLADFSDGVWWVDLASISSGERIAAAIASAIRIRLSEGDVGSQIAQALARRHVLLVLDNCEHLASDVALLVAGILRSSAKLRILITSQEVVRTKGFAVYRLGPLPLPAPPASLDEARTYDSIRLLEQRARAFDPRFSLNEETIADAIRICRRLDGIPLALEMAAARLPLMGARALADQLDKRLELLRNASDTAIDRQRTLLATLEWSHSLLSDVERKLLRHLAVFVGSFRLESAQIVASECGLSEIEAIDALGALVDKSLLQEEPWEPPRYRLLETTRTFADTQLALYSDREAASRLHAIAMAALAERLLGLRYEMNSREWVVACMPHYPDLERAFDRAFELGDAEVFVATGELLQFLDFERDIESEALRRKEAALAVLASSHGVTRARLLSMLSLFRFAIPSGRDRIENSRERVAAWTAIGDRWQRCVALYDLAWNLSGADDVIAARRTMTEARVLEDSEWSPARQLALAHCRLEVGLFCRDAQIIREACGTMERLGWDHYSHVGVNPQSGRAALAYITGEGDAVELLRACAERGRRHDRQRAMPNILGALCAAHVQAGNIEQARMAAAEALALPIMWQARETRAVDHFAVLAVRLGRHAEAARLLGFNDSIYASGKDGRQWPEAVSAERAMHDIEHVLGPAEARRLREEGAQMTRRQAAAIANDVVGAASA